MALTSSLYKRYSPATVAENADKAKTVTLRLVLTDEQKAAIAAAVGESASQKELGVKVQLTIDAITSADEQGRPITLFVGQRRNIKTQALNTASLWVPVAAE